MATGIYMDNNMSRYITDVEIALFLNICDLIWLLLFGRVSDYWLPKHQSVSNRVFGVLIWGGEPS